MGDYFDDEEIEEAEEKPEAEDGIEEEEEVKIRTLKDIITHRNKAANELILLKKDAYDRIGRLNISLFGDPNNPEWESKLEILEEELNHPMTRQHPIAHKMKAVVEEVKQYQLEYNRLRKAFDKYLKVIGGLLDDAIKVHQKDKEKWEKEIMVKEGKTQQQKEAEYKSYVTNELVGDFMTSWGNTLMSRYKMAIEDRGNFHSAKKIRNEWIDKAKYFFANFHERPDMFAEMLLDKLSKHPWSEVRKLRPKEFSAVTSSNEEYPEQPESEDKKNIQPEISENEVGQNQPQNDPLKGND